MRVSFQGERGAYSEEAIMAHWGEAAEPLPRPYLPDVFDAVEKGERSASSLEALIQGMLKEASLAEIDYVEIVDAASMAPLEELHGDCLVAVAVRFGDVRLIDNVRVAV